MSKKNISILLHALFILICTGNLFALPKSTDEIYTEKVYMHIDRNTFISGESLWFKAYCFNTSNSSLPVKSKILYVELVDQNQVHILGKVLNIENGTASSSLDFPDSLSSGTYEIKAYTNWMRNFRKDNFYSSIIYIQNPFNDVVLKNFYYSLKNSISVFIEGGSLIEGLPNTIGLQLPYIPREKISGTVLDGSNRVVDSLFFDPEGKAIFKLTPDAGKLYHCIFTGGNFNDQSIHLPSPLASGYQIHAERETGGNISFHILASHAVEDEFHIELKGNDVSQIIQVKNQNNSSFELSAELCRNGLIKILLVNSENKILAYNYYSCQHPNLLKASPIRNIYGSREKINFTLCLDNETIDTGSYSISVSKVNPLNSEIQEHMDINSISENGNFLNYTDQNDIQHILPEYNNTDIQNRNDITDFEFPVEDIGNLYTGKCFNSKTGKAASKVQVITSTIDSIPSLQSFNTDNQGNFAFLLYGSGPRNVLLQSYRNDSIIDKEIKIVLNNKYCFSKKIESNQAKSIPVWDSVFQKYLEQEIKRIEILRAFEDRKIKKYRPKASNALAFYGKPDYNLKLEDYVFFNNFQEIINEIITYTKFNKKKKGCDMSVFNPEYDIYYENPVVLVNGIPVNNLCILFSLNSNDIDHIEVQAHERVSENLIYRGLVSIYLKGNNKKFLSQLVQDKKVIVLDGSMNDDKINTCEFEQLDSISDKKPYFMNQIYWNPNAKFGKLIEFYTSDEEGEYLLHVEGLNEKGVPVFYEKKFLVKN